MTVVMMTMLMMIVQPTEHAAILGPSTEQYITIKMDIRTGERIEDQILPEETNTKAGSVLIIAIMTMSTARRVSGIVIEPIGRV